MKFYYTYEYRAEDTACKGSCVTTVRDASGLTEATIDALCEEVKTRGTELGRPPVGPIILTFIIPLEE